MKTLVKFLFLAFAVVSFSFASAQDKTKKTTKTTTTKSTKETKKTGATHKTKKKASKKSTKGTSSTKPKEKPTNAAVDQNSMKKKPAGQ